MKKLPYFSFIFILIFCGCNKDSGNPATPDPPVPMPDFVMVPISAGSFIMGATSEQDTFPNNELPTRKISLSAFEIGAHEVTQQLWISVMGKSHSGFLPYMNYNFPALNISWLEAVNFCNALSLRKGLNPVYRIEGAQVSMDIYANGYRLPTEAEWEYAARGGKFSQNFKYSGSNNLSEVAWISSCMRVELKKLMNLVFLI